MPARMNIFSPADVDANMGNFIFPWPKKEQIALVQIPPIFTDIDCIALSELLAGIAQKFYTVPLKYRLRKPRTIKTFGAVTSP